jgi:NSS family neurotransmitter:Na+ symporter
MQQRDHWSSRMGFVLAAAGSAIGLGNLWKFPYITWDNQGGAFVLVYLACIVVVGLPIMMAELLIGRRTQKSAVGALKEAVGPAWGLIGLLGVLTGFVILSYYSVIAGWSLRNFAQCVQWSVSGFPEGIEVGAEFVGFLSNWKAQVLVSVLFMMATMGVVSGGIGRGIERVARLLMPMLFVIMTLLLVSALTMKGNARALEFIFVPKFDQLTLRSVLEALGHAFFTLSLGMGAMITYGSYMSRKESLVRASAVVVALDTVIALVATVIMFSVIFSVDGLVEQVGKSSVGMLFITLPDLFYTRVPLGRLLAPLFYLLVSFAALTSTISLLEVVVSFCIDELKMTRRKATALCGVSILSVTVLCSLSLGAWGTISNFSVFSNDAGPKLGLLSNLDHLASNWMLPLGGFFITVATGWFLTRKTTESELVDESTPAWFNYGIWRFFIRFVAPVAVAAIILAVIVTGKDFS